MSGYPKQAETTEEREARLRSYRYPGGPSIYSSPPVEPLASRLERAQRVEWSRYETRRMLDALDEAGEGWRFVDNVWVKGLCVPFLVFGVDAGVCLIWSVDGRWTPKQAAMVMPAREQIQRELGDDFPGQVEVMFHIPRQATGWYRHVLVDEEHGQPIDIVAVGGRIDQVLAGWKPIGGVGLDPLWVDRLCRAGQPRWWLSDEGMRHPPEPPSAEQV